VLTFSVRCSDGTNRDCRRFDTIIRKRIFDMASTFSRLRGHLDDDLESQVAKLSREVSSLKKTLSKRGAEAYEDTRDSASDMYEDIVARLSDSMPDIAKQSRAVRKAARDNPVASTVVGIAVVGLLLGLLTRAR
jgi:ElaB/YqjD/DUF883 family membrane-anchored ribosome-binding protein